MMTTAEVILLAQKHSDSNNNDSAKICLTDAFELYNQGNLIDARTRAIKSLKYSIGILHPDFKYVME